MATQPPSSLPPSSPPPPPPQYWCHHCDKRVSVETLPGQPDVICNDCKFGFVESIPSSSTPALISPLSGSSDFNFNVDDDTTTPNPFIGGSGVIDDTTLGSQFIHVLRLLAQVARDDHPSPPSPPPPPPPRAGADHRDFLRIEIDGNNEEQQEEEEEDDDDDDDDGNNDEESVRSVEIEGDSDDNADESEEELRRRQRRDMLRLRLRDFATRARSGGRNRILDWAEILMGLENNSIELRFEVPETERYIGNPGDYVNEAEYEALLQNLAEADGRRGAPPASKSAVEGLKTVEVKDEEGCFVCAICKDGVSVGEVVKEMPCGHGYHGDCIVTWLDARNSCPVCRFELITDDAEYEEEKRKRNNGGSNAGSSALGNSSSAAASSF